MLSTSRNNKLQIMIKNDNNSHSYMSLPEERGVTLCFPFHKIAVDESTLFSILILRRSLIGVNFANILNLGLLLLKSTNFLLTPTSKYA